MSETSLKPVIEKLENLFSKFNEKFYNGELQTPIITVSPDTTKGAYGWCTAWKAWSNKQPEQKKTVDLAAMSKEDLENLKKDEGFYEINICAEHLARPFEQVAETLLHEMVHLYNLQIGVQDTSRGWTSATHEEAASGSGKGNAKAYADSLKINHFGNTVVIEIVNPVEYASYVEYGHRTANHQGWVQGRFMLTISEQEIQNIAPKVLESKIKKFLGECMK